MNKLAEIELDEIGTYPIDDTFDEDHYALTVRLLALANEAIVELRHAEKHPMDRHRQRIIEELYTCVGMGIGMGIK